MDFLSYLSSKKKIRLPLSFLVAIVSFMLCAHRLHGIQIFNCTNKKIKILSFVEMATEKMRSSGSGKFCFEINKNNNTISPKNLVNIENKVHSNYFIDGKCNAKFYCLLMKVKHDGKTYEFNTNMIPESTRHKLEGGYVVLCLKVPSSKESRDSNYFDKKGKWNGLNMRFYLRSNMIQEKPSSTTT